MPIPKVNNNPKIENFEVFNKEIKTKATNATKNYFSKESPSN